MEVKHLSGFIWFSLSFFEPEPAAKASIDLGQKPLLNL
jgi:hypothetical protein